MSNLWTAKEIAAATNGDVQGSFTANGISIDTRSLKSGDLFVAIKDARDGHDFIKAAFTAGASGVLASQPHEAPRGVMVEDTVQALRDLAVAARDRNQAVRIGVTGSVGKTSVKDALFTLFSTFGHAHKSQKSFNNHFGVPITLASMSQESDYGIFELGMNHAGELTDLSGLVAPQIAVITNIEMAHLANFENIEAIARAKAEIMEGMSSSGTIVLNGDNAQTALIENIAKEKNLRVIKFGYSDDHDVTIVSTNSHSMGGNVRLRIATQQIDVTLRVPGEHWFVNAAACMAVAHAAGVDLRKAAMALRKVTASEGRGDVCTANIDGKTVTVIDESYNANPASMRAAFTAAALKPGRKIAVLGDMGELGPDELDLHAGLSQPLIDAGFARVIVVGETMRALRGALPQEMRAGCIDTVEQAFAALNEEVQDGDVLLIKGSNSVGLGKLAKTLKCVDETKAALRETE
ncbi:MAG: UDP-N-acetylmuramoyl-tripeptide--D-alanyl-D-alanine ligase [Litorimonas sp.]